MSMRLDVYQDTGQRVVYAADGKVLAMKESGVILGSVMWLAKSFDIGKLMEVDAPVVEEVEEELLE